MGDGHTGLEHRELKREEDERLEYILSYLKGTMDGGEWIVHISPKEPSAITPELEAVFDLLELKRFEPCPYSAHRLCYWKSFGGPRGEDDWYKAKAVHAWVGQLKENFGQACNLIIAADNDLRPIGVQLLDVPAPLERAAERQAAPMPAGRRREKPTVSLSYSSQDKAFVERLAKELREAGTGVWFDQWEIKVGDSIVDKINQGIQQNDYLAIVLSPDSVASDWVRKELNAALVKELHARRVVILPILYRDCEIPPLIAEKKYADFRRDYSQGFGELLDALQR